MAKKVYVSVQHNNPPLENAFRGKQTFDSTPEYIQSIPTIEKQVEKYIENVNSLPEWKPNKLGRIIFLVPAGKLYCNVHTGWEEICINSNECSVLINSGNMNPTFSNGSIPNTLITPKNNQIFDSMDFDNIVEQSSTFSIQLPDFWNEDTKITASIRWTSTSGIANEDVSWNIRCAAISEDCNLDSEYGKSTNIKDIFKAPYQLHITPDSNYIIPSGTPSANAIVIFEIKRCTLDDSLSSPAKVLDIKLNFFNS